MQGITESRRNENPRISLLEWRDLCEGEEEEDAKKALRIWQEKKERM